MENNRDYCLYCFSMECPFMKNSPNPLPCEIGECAHLLRALDELAGLQLG